MRDGPSLGPPAGGMLAPDDDVGKIGRRHRINGSRFGRWNSEAPTKPSASGGDRRNSGRRAGNDEVASRKACDPIPDAGSNPRDRDRFDITRPTGRASEV